MAEKTSQPDAGKKKKQFFVFPSCILCGLGNGGNPSFNQCAWIWKFGDDSNNPQTQDLGGKGGEEA